HDDVFTDPWAADRLAAMAYSGLRLLRLQDYYEHSQRCVMLDGLTDSWFCLDRPLRPARWHALFKRITDLVAGVIGSLLVAFVIPLVWLAIRFDDGGPLIFRQERIGLNS